MLAKFFVMFATIGVTTGCVTKEFISDIVGQLNANINVMLNDRKGQPYTKPRDCEDVQKLGNLKTGVYKIYPYRGEIGMSVRCDMDTTGGGWTVFQRRISDSDFYLKWGIYETGFGDLDTNFWLGNRYIHMISNQDDYELRIDLTSSNYETAYAEYSIFVVGHKASKYRLTATGYSGTAGDGFKIKGNGAPFTTYDQNNDLTKRENCAVSYHGAWWYAGCHDTNLNGDYGNKAYAKGPVWQFWKGDYDPMIRTEMKMKRKKN